MRERAQTVIVGAGIVGASAAYHLAELGVTDVLVIDQGPLFETGGSTSHAPGIIFQTNGSRTMCRIAQDTVALYDSLDLDGERVWYGVGGLEVATTPERMQELKRRQGFARSYGIEGTELLTPAEAAEKSPLLDPSTILGAYWVPSDGAGKGVKIAEALARRARRQASAFEGGVTVTGFDVRDGRVHGVETDRGRVECERVAALRRHLGSDGGGDGRRSDPARGRPAPARVDRPDPRARGLDGDTWAQHPVVRHQDMSLYFRQRDDHYGVGNYRHEPIATPQSGIRPPGQRDAAVADAVHARGLRPLRGRDRADVPRARGPDAARRPGALAERDVLVHARRRLDRGGERADPRRLGVRGRLGHARRRDGAAGGRVDGVGASRRTTWPKPTRTGSTRSRRRRPTCGRAASSSTARSTTSSIPASRCPRRAACG